MIEFERLNPGQKDAYLAILDACPPRSCEYSFVNLFCWGLQQAAFRENTVLFFSHFNGRSVYPFPIGTGNRKEAVEELLDDARRRGIPCRLVGMTEADCRDLESWFPGKFRIRADRDGFDYVYDIDDLADLKGRKFQKKRNHVNRFMLEHPDCRVLSLEECNFQAVRDMTAGWYLARKAQDPFGDYLLESVAINRALHNWRALGLDGCVLEEQGKVLAMALGSRLSRDTFDIHFEKADQDSEGAYAMINRSFARYLREKYPEIRCLNREDDMGSEGLRKSKLSYQPHHLEEKYWAMIDEECFPGDDVYGDQDL